MFQQYSRPGYDYIEGDPQLDSNIEGYGLAVKDVFQLPENVSLADAGLDVGLTILYTGNRWIGSYFLRTTDLQIMSNGVSNYHGELLGGCLHPLASLWYQKYTPLKDRGKPGSRKLEDGSAW